MARSVLRLLVALGTLAVIGPLPDMLQADERLRHGLYCATSRHTCYRGRCGDSNLPEEVVGVTWHEEVCMNSDHHPIARQWHKHPDECCWLF